jgi:hypothetical protein
MTSGRINQVSLLSFFFFLLLLCEEGKKETKKEKKERGVFEEGGEHIRSPQKGEHTHLSFLSLPSFFSFEKIYCVSYFV